MPDSPLMPADGSAPGLLVVAHGTRSAAGTATTQRLVAAIAQRRPSIRVALCYLDIGEPGLPDALAGTDQSSTPTVVLPLLLSTGQHLLADIPNAVGGRRHIRVARHLGPDALLTDVLVDRLLDVWAERRVERPVDLAGVGHAGATVLVAAGSNRPEAGIELRAAGDLLAERTGSRVTVLTMADDVRAALRGLRLPIRIAPYLLTEGHFIDQLRAAAAGLATVAEPLGVHPALVTLVWSRFDDAVSGVYRTSEWSDP